MITVRGLDGRDTNVINAIAVVVAGEEIAGTPTVFAGERIEQVAAADSHDLVVEFQAEAGAVYDLETRTDLATTSSWGVAVAGIPGVDGTVTVTTTPPPGSKRLFFRVTRLP